MKKKFSVNSNYNFSFKIFSLAFVIILVLPVLIQDGMFMDGQQYACVSKNLAEGRGSFWFPHLNDTWVKAGSSDFMEHPPLVYAMQAVFFKCFGNSIYSERLYSLFTLSISLILITCIWKIIFPKKSGYSQFWWIAVLFWIWTPLTSWCYQNNMMENSMVMFDLLSVLLLLKFLRNEKYKVICFIGGSLSVFLAFLSKGIPGIFPLIVIPVYGLIFKDRSFRFYSIYSLVFIILTSFWFIVLMQWQEAHKSLSFYLSERVFVRISDNATVDSHFHIVLKLLENLSPLVIIAIIMAFVRKRSRISVFSNDVYKYFSLILVIGLSASLPIMLTKVQRGFYLMPSFPFYAMAAAVFCLPTISYWIQKMKRRTIKLSMIIAVVFAISSIVLTISKFGKESRDKLILQDVHNIGKIVPENTIMKVPEDLYYNNWSMQMYLTRHYNISLLVSNDYTEWFISEKDSKNGNLIIKLKTEPYALYKSLSE